MIHVGMGRKSVPFPILTLALSIVGLVMCVIGVADDHTSILMPGLVMVGAPGVAASGIRSTPVGHNPIPPRRDLPPPDRESFHLGRAREVLGGGWLSEHLEPRGPAARPDPPPDPSIRSTR